MNELILHTAPIGPLLSVHQIIGGRVLFNYFRDSAFKHEVYTGIAREVKQSVNFGWMVLIEADEGQGFNLPPRWISASSILGWAWWDTVVDVVVTAA